MNVIEIYASEWSRLFLETPTSYVRVALEQRDCATVRVLLDCNTSTTTSTTVVPPPIFRVLGTAPFRIDVNITKLDSDAVVVTSPMPAVVETDGEDYTASLTEANVSMSGSTCSEAIKALRGFIEHIYVKASSETKLGPSMKATVAYLKGHLADAAVLNKEGGSL